MDVVNLSLFRSEVPSDSDGFPLKDTQLAGGIFCTVARASNLSSRQREPNRIKTYYAQIVPSP